MRLANEVPRIHRSGAEVIAVVVDPEGRNAALAKSWHLPFRVVSDPRGERFLKPLDLWNADERGGIAVPALLVISPQGEEVFRVRSRDFADRVNDEDALGSLEQQGYPALDPPPPAWQSQVELEIDRGAYKWEFFGPYFRGNQYGALALSLRAKDPTALEEIKAHGKMSASFLAAWKARREAEAAP